MKICGIAIPAYLPSSPTNQPTNLPTAGNRVHLQKLTAAQIVMKFHIFYGNWKLITMFTIVQHLSLSWARLFQSMPYHPISWRSILILSSHIPNALLPSDFPMKTLYTFIFTTTYAIWPTHLIFFDLITQTAFGEEKNSSSSSLCNSLQPPVTSSLLGQNNKGRVRCASCSCTNRIRKPKFKVPLGNTGFE